MPKMNLRHSHKAELLYSLVVAMVTVFPWQQRLSINTYCHKEHSLPNMNLGYFHVVELLHNSFVSIVTIVTIATR